MAHRVLVADDDPDFLAAVALSLEKDGAVVVCATSGADLLERLAEDASFDLVVTDISMPWMSGLQVANAARVAGLEVPFVVMTGLGDPTIDARVLALGNHSSLLRKPFTLAQLREAVAQSLPREPAGASGAA